MDKTVHNANVTEMKNSTVECLIRIPCNRYKRDFYDLLFFCLMCKQRKICLKSYQGEKNESSSSGLTQLKHRVILQ